MRKHERCSIHLQGGEIVDTQKYLCNLIVVIEQFLYHLYLLNSTGFANVESC